MMHNIYLQKFLYSATYHHIPISKDKYAMVVNRLNCCILITEALLNFQHSDDLFPSLSPKRKTPEESEKPAIEKDPKSLFLKL